MLEKLFQNKEKRQKEENFYFTYSIYDNDLKKILQSKNKLIKVTIFKCKYEEVFQTINYLNKKKSNIQFIIELESKKEFNDFIFNNPHFQYMDKVFINYCSNLISLKDYLKWEKLLFEIVKPAFELSPLEKFLYAYNIVKNFKQYKESENPPESRELYHILNNEYIVCAGYVNLLQALLEKLNISSISFSITGYSIEENKQIYHAILQYKLVDGKYGINGIYYADPTNDSFIDFDRYTYSLMLKWPNLYKTRFLCDLIFDIKSIEEFYDRFEYIITNSQNIKSDNLIRITLETIRKLDPKFAKKYSTSKIEKMNQKEVIDIIGNYLVKNLNNPVDNDLIYRAVKVLYRKFYGFKDKKSSGAAFNITKFYNIRLQESLNRNLEQEKIIKPINR